MINICKLHQMEKSYNCSPNIKVGKMLFCLFFLTKCNHISCTLEVNPWIHIHLFFFNILFKHNSCTIMNTFSMTWSKVGPNHLTSMGQIKIFSFFWVHVTKRPQQELMELKVNLDLNIQIFILSVLYYPLRHMIPCPSWLELCYTTIKPNQMLIWSNSFKSHVSPMKFKAMLHIKGIMFIIIKNIIVIFYK